MCEACKFDEGRLWIRPRSIKVEPPGREEEGKPLLVFMHNGKHGIWETGSVVHGRLHGAWIIAEHLAGYTPTHWSPAPASPVADIEVI